MPEDEAQKGALLQTGGRASARVGGLVGEVASWHPASVPQHSRQYGQACAPPPTCSLVKRWREDSRCRPKKMDCSRMVLYCGTQAEGRGEGFVHRHACRASCTAGSRPAGQAAKQRRRNGAAHPQQLILALILHRLLLLGALACRLAQPLPHVGWVKAQQRPRKVG